MRPRWRSAVGVGAEQAEQVRAERAARGPGLLPGEPPAAGRVVAHGAARDAGEVAAGVGLGPALAPQVLARAAIRGRIAVLLLRRAELEERRREQEDAVLGDPLRRAGRGSTPPRRSATPTASRRGRRTPRARRRPPSGRRSSRRSHSRWRGEALPGVARRQRLGRHVRLQPVPDLGPERLLLRAPRQVHAAREPTRPTATAGQSGVRTVVFARVRDLCYESGC